MNLSFVRVKGSDLAKEIKPSDAELAKYYEEHQEAFREPERVGIDYVSYNPKDFAKGGQVSDADIEQEYNAFKAERYTEPEEVHARHVLLTVARDADDKQRDAVRARATAVLERLKKGEDFAAVAKEVSEDKANKDKGGDLGFIRRGNAEEAFESAAFALQAGELSGVVETRFGFHVIRVDERKAPREKPLAEVRDEIAETLRADRARNAARDAVFADAEKASTGTSLAELAKARGLEVENPPLFAEHEEIRGLGFQRELSKAAFATPPGQAGPVTEVGEALVLFRVREKLQSRVPPLADIRDKVETAIRDEQATAKARERAEAMRKLLAENKTLEEVATVEKLTVEETGLFTRAGDYVPRIGSSPELKKEAFQLSAASPVAPDVTVVGGDAYVVVFKDRQPADMAEFEKKKSGTRQAPPRRSAAGGDDGVDQPAEAPGDDSGQFGSARRRLRARAAPGAHRPQSRRARSAVSLRRRGNRLLAAPWLHRHPLRDATDRRGARQARLRRACAAAARARDVRRRPGGDHLAAMVRRGDGRVDRSR